MEDNRRRGRGRGRSTARQDAPAAAAGGAVQPGARGRAVSVASEPSDSSSVQRPIGRADARSSAPVASSVARQMETLAVSAGSSRGSGNGNGNGNGNGDPASVGAKPIGRGNVRFNSRQLEQTLQTRPESVVTKKGTSGQVTKITTNSMRLTATDNWVLYKHHVDFNPPEDRTFIRKILLRPHEAKFGGHLFDGSTLFSTTAVCPEGKPLDLFSVRQSDEAKIKITIKRVGTCQRGDYQRLQVFNIILRKCLATLKLELIRRNYYDPAAEIPIPEHRLKLWPGFTTSIGQFENDILLQCEINFKVLRMDTAYNLFRDIADRGGGDIRKTFSNAVIGCVVMTKYNRKTYRIDDVDYSVNPRGTFPRRNRDGTTTNVSYIDYFREAYGENIMDSNQPMLVSRRTARQKRALAQSTEMTEEQKDLIYLVPELSVMTGLTDDMRNNHQLMRAQASHTAIPGNDRSKQIVKFAQRLLGQAEAVRTLTMWGMRLEPRLVEIESRVLPQETITMFNRVAFKSGPDVDWTRNLRTNQMLNTAQLNKWVLIFTSRNEPEARSLFTQLQSVGRNMKFMIPSPERGMIQNDSAPSYVNEIESSINKHNPQLVVLLVPNNRQDRYSAIKKKCILDRPVPSQVVLVKSVNNKNAQSICTKIAIQINCKIGGAPWAVSIPLEGLMVVGFDVCHDPRDKRKSYGAMVASIDKNITKYYSAIKHHSAGEELSANFGMNIRNAVKFYKENNGTFPKKIIVYRDGVGDGNMAYVLENEVKQIWNNLTQMYKDDKDCAHPPTLAFVIVSKRINTRFFNTTSGTREGNPVPGTVVDDVVTSPFRYDFFLISQSVRQGTVSPTHYNVVWDNTGLSADHMQRLTYKLTHMYFNWSGTVRVPAPCQYAHKLAFLTSQSVGSDHNNLNNFLYFL